MPNRMLRDWTDSDRMDSVSFHAEVLFVRLMMKADDYGSFHANPKLINSFCFPLKNLRETDITRWLHELVAADLIALYEADNKRYLNILNFGQRLRSMRKTFPAFDGNSPPLDSDSLTFVRNLPPEVEGEVEEETEVEQPPKQSFYQKEEERFFSIDHCAEVAMRDSKWVQDSKATAEKIELFKKNLLGQGIREKTFKDFKKHFFFWSEKQKLNDGDKIKRTDTANPNSGILRTAC